MALKRGLELAGWRVLKLNFNAGDRFFARGAGCRSHRGDELDFSEWLNSLCRNDRPDLITMFGDQRPLHRIATQTAKHWNIPVWSFEEGYLRPGYVTLEPGGNNHCSPLPRVPQAYSGVQPDPPGAIAIGTASHFIPMALRAMVYSAAMVAGRRAFPAYRHHRQCSATAEAVAWARSLARKLGRYRRNRSDLERVLSGRSGGYFLVACQVPDDLQVRRHGRGWTVERLIREAVASFARTAPAGTLLVVKAHPLARGHLDHAAIIGRAAAASGCADRVVLIDSGPMGPLAKKCLAMLTINSTAGLAALGHGRPVAALGDSIYVMPGLAHQINGASLDSVWSGLALPAPTLWSNFRAQILRGSLLPGDFYLTASWPVLVRTAVARLSGSQADDALTDLSLAPARAYGAATQSSEPAGQLAIEQSPIQLLPYRLDANDLVPSP
jgi:capsular polysaccharide export protein